MNNRILKNMTFLLYLAAGVSSLAWFGYSYISSTELYRKNFKPVEYWAEVVEDRKSNVTLSDARLTLAALELRKFQESQATEFQIRYIEKHYISDNKRKEELILKELETEHTELIVVYEMMEEQLKRSEQRLEEAEITLKQTKHKDQSS